MHPTRTLLRLAHRLDRTWRHHAPHPDADEPSWHAVAETWNRLQSLRRQVHRARRRGFVYCLPRLQENVRRTIEDLSRAVASLRGCRGSADRPPSLRDWLHELRALEGEFGDVEIDVRQATLGVTTDSITLDGVELGPFAVDLIWSRFAPPRGAACFAVTALEPHPATGSDDVTHPHVKADGLCAGEAATPVQRALRAGRITDAFVLIRSVLTPYNPRSAYVPLSAWEGSNCGDCGGRMNRDEGGHCPGCRTDQCDECTAGCRACDETRCRSCLSACERCGDSCCSGCVETIASGESVCASCRGICDGCGTAVLGTKLNDGGLCELCAETADRETPPTPTLEEIDVT